MRTVSTSDVAILQLKRIISKPESEEDSGKAAHGRVSTELTLAERDARQFRESERDAAEALCSRVLEELWGAGASSIVIALDARLRACDPERGDLRALAPCAEVDSLLRRVVSIIQGDYAPHMTLDDDMEL